MTMMLSAVTQSPRHQRRNPRSLGASKTSSSGPGEVSKKAEQHLWRGIGILLLLCAVSLETGRKRAENHDTCKLRNLNHEIEG